MTSEEFQKLVLGQLTELTKGQQRLATGQQQLTDTVSNINRRLENVEGQLSETNSIVKSLLHNTEELDAKFDGLLNVTASNSSVEEITNKLDRMAGDITFLVRKAAEHEDDIRKLKLIK